MVSSLRLFGEAYCHRLQSLISDPEDGQ